MEYRTREFARLYGLVSEQLALITQDFSWRSQPERDWLAYLVIVFQELFADWDRDPKLRDYLQGLEVWEGRDVHPVFRLAGHVYLHVSYDLVRGVAGTLATAMPVLPPHLHIVPANARTLSVPPPIKLASRAGARMAFLAASPAFPAALGSRDAVDLLGEITVWAKVLGVLPRKKRELALRIIAQWVLALRNAAFIAGETIADVAPADRPLMVGKLLQGIEDARRDSQKGFTTTDLEPWGFPILGVAPLPFLLAPPWMVAAIATLVVAIAWISWIAKIRRRQRALLGAIDNLGLGILRALAKAGWDAKEFPQPKG